MSTSPVSNVFTNRDLLQNIAEFLPSVDQLVLARVNHIFQNTINSIAQREQLLMGFEKTVSPTQVTRESVINHFLSFSSNKAKKVRNDLEARPLRLYQHASSAMVILEAPFQRRRGFGVALSDLVTNEQNFDRALIISLLIPHRALRDNALLNLIQRLDASTGQVLEAASGISEEGKRSQALYRIATTRGLTVEESFRIISTIPNEFIKNAAFYRLIIDEEGHLRKGVPTEKAFEIANSITDDTHKELALNSLKDKRGSKNCCIL